MYSLKILLAQQTNSNVLKQVFQCLCKRSSASKVLHIRQTYVTRSARFIGQGCKIQEATVRTPSLDEGQLIGVLKYRLSDVGVVCYFQVRQRVAPKADTALD